MELYLIRHPETSAPKGTCYGRTDFPLKYPVEDTADSTFAYLPPNFNHFVSSPAPRAKKLAKALLSKYHPIKIPAEFTLNTDDRLLEMDFGDWDGKLWDEIPRKETIPWMKDFVNARTPNGEAFTDLIHRVDLFLEDWTQNGILKQKWETKHKQTLESMIVVCHSGPIRAILCRINGIPHEEAFKSPVEFGSVHKVQI